MLMFAIAGGAGPGDEDVLWCCGMCPLLPLVVFLAGYAVYRNSLWLACLSLLLTSAPYLLLRQMVEGYQPSTDGDVTADQNLGRQAVGLYTCLMGVAGLSLGWVVGRRVLSRITAGKSEGQGDQGAG